MASRNSKNLRSKKLKKLPAYCSTCLAKQQKDAVFIRYKDFQLGAFGRPAITTLGSLLGSVLILKLLGFL